MRFIKKLLQFLITGSFSFIIAACYGVMVSYSETEKKLRVVNKDNQPVNGLYINIGSNVYPEYYYTDENGEAIFYPMIDEYNGGLFNPVIKDIDGEENLGCFARTEVVLDDEAEQEVVIAVNENTYSEIEKKLKFVTEKNEPISGLRVSLCDSGCYVDEFITDENGEIIIHPIINKDGVMETIFVTDEDWTNNLGFFGTDKEIILTDENEMIIVLDMETPPEEPVEQTEQKIPDEQEKREDKKSG